MELPGEKLVIKLWDTLADKGVGALLTPWQTAREGRALNEVRRQEILMLAQAEKDASDLRAGRKQLSKDGTALLICNETADINDPCIDVNGRIEPILGLPQAFRKAAITDAVNSARAEINSSKAVLYAEEQLAHDTQTPPDREVDDDWLYAWCDYAGKVSTEDLQRLWGSVLAGEIKSPGNYSLRTLEFLKTLSKQEAERIGNLARYVISGVIPSSQNEYLEANGFNFGMLMHMQSLGVISGVDSLGIQQQYKSVRNDKFVRVLISNGKGLFIEHDEVTKTLNLEVCLLTDVGAQILGLGSFEPDVEYLRLIGKQIAAMGYTVQLGDWIQVTETQGRCINTVHISTEEI